MEVPTGNICFKMSYALIYCNRTQNYKTSLTNLIMQIFVLYLKTKP